MRVAVTVTEFFKRHCAFYWDTETASQNNNQSVSECPYTDWNESVFTCQRNVEADCSCAAASVLSAVCVQRFVHSA